MKRIRKWATDDCWFRTHENTMTRSHVLLHCLKWVDGREHAFRKSSVPPSIHVLLIDPRWEKVLKKLIKHTKIGRKGPDRIDDEIRRILANDTCREIKFSDTFDADPRDVTAIETSSTINHHDQPS